MHYLKIQPFNRFRHDLNYSDSAFLFISIQPSNPLKIIRKTIDIAKQETITKEDCQLVLQLVKSEPNALSTYLKRENMDFKFRVMFIDAILSDGFYTSNDTTILYEREKIYLKVREEYHPSSKEVKLANSRLVEIYSLCGKYNQAIKLANKNLTSCNYPSFDHATCLYTQAWALSKAKKDKQTIVIMKESLQEYQQLILLAKETLQDDTLTTEEIALFKHGLEEAQAGKKMQNLFWRK